MTTYKIIRFKRDDENEVLETGLTLEEAQEHCNDPATSGDGWSTATPPKTSCPARTTTGTAMTTDVPAAELAKELGITVGNLLQRADDTIARVVYESGLDGARGLTTRVVNGRIFLTAPLAQHLRETA